MKVNSNSIYRVLQSPTSFYYAVLRDDVRKVETYHSLAAAVRVHGPMDLVIIGEPDFEVAVPEHWDSLTPKSTIHAHFEITATDCDGQIDRSYVVQAWDHEDEIDFHERVVSMVVDTYALLRSASLRVDKLESDEVQLVWDEPTDEGFRHTVVVICNRDDCNENETTYRDHRAEEMGY